MNCRLLLLVLSITCAFPAFSQGIVKGKITDENRQPLAGANILIAGTAISATSDRNGNFRLTNLKPGSLTADVSYIGYARQSFPFEIRDGETTALDVTLTVSNIQLEDIVVSSAPDRPINTLSQIDIRFRPVNSAQDILRLVPGLFIAQHAGGGKAEQIFLRGFDCDHGTDIQVEVDGLPVNMASHAHGQGYADLHFLMPEMVNVADFDKGPYFANKGDFNTAGYIAFQTKDRLDRNFLKLEGGSFNTGRVAAGVNVFETTKSNVYIASEFFKSDGFFENNQKFKRLNLQARYNTKLGEQSYLSASFTAFDSHWNASGQIPDRAVADGSITRYGSIDPTEGGSTSRYNTWIKLVSAFGNGGTFENQAYAVRYDFNLFSNFTFFLNDPVNGDQINQKDGRWIYGYRSRYQQASVLFGRPFRTDVGLGGRYDVINDIALNHTIRRSFLNHVKYGDVREGNANAYVSETLDVTDRFSINAAVRLDHFYFDYHDKLPGAVQLNSASKSIINPKLNLTYQLSPALIFFVRSGTGFHSNDARVVVARLGKEILPRAYGLDLGSDFKVTPKLLIHAALWRLDLDQEFVYVGDAGIVEPSGKTKRIGLDLSARYQINDWIFADLDYNLTRPRAKGEPEGQNYIPLAPVRTGVGGLTVRKGYGFNGSLRYRYIGDRPANENNSIIASGYFIMDAILNYTKKMFEVGLSVENLLDRDWKEAQFATESRLQNEAVAVDEIHFTPGTPFNLKVRFVKFF